MPVTIDSVQAATIMGRIQHEHLLAPEPQTAPGVSRARENGFISSGTNEVGL